jgi:hypothetical protein
MARDGADRFAAFAVGGGDLRLNVPVIVVAKEKFNERIVS